MVAITFPPNAGRVDTNNLFSVSISRPVQSAVHPASSLKESLGRRCPGWEERWGGWLKEMQEAINDGSLDIAKGLVGKMEMDIRRCGGDGTTRPSPHPR